MKLRDFLEQFKDLDPEMEVYKQDYDDPEQLQYPESTIYKFGYVEKCGKHIFYEDFIDGNRNTKVIVLY